MPTLIMGTREKTLWKKAIFSALTKKINFRRSSDESIIDNRINFRRDDFFPDVAIRVRIRVFYYFSIMGRVVCRPGPKYQNTP